MVNLKGALFSLEAKGSISNIITYSKRKSGQQCRYQKKQTNATNATQQPIRDSFRLGLDLWRSLTSTEKGYWNTIEKEGYVNV